MEPSAGFALAMDGILPRPTLIQGDAHMPIAGRRVLVVEDEYLAALTTVDVLERIGCEVVGPVGRLPAALQLARSDALDAAVLDINIAGTMVWPVAEELLRRSVPYLFLSAYSEQNMIPARFASAPCLAKPLEPARLVHRLGTMWDVPLVAD
jgi:CheY-like chemotaxis protein